jgi:hypothetical protein
MTALPPCVESAKKLYDLRFKYRDASVLITAIYAESQVIAASLSHIRSLLEHDTLRKKPELLETFDRALTGCRVVYVCLEEEVRELALKAENDDLDFRDRAKFLWKEDTFKELLTQIRGQQSGLSLLVQGLQMESIADIKRLVEENSAALENAVKRSKTLRQSHPKLTVPESLFSQGMAGNHDAEFTFDDDVVNSKAYRRAMTTALSTSHVKTGVLDDPKNESLRKEPSALSPVCQVNGENQDVFGTDLPPAPAAGGAMRGTRVSDTKPDSQFQGTTTHEHQHVFETLERDLLAYMPPTMSATLQPNSSPSSTDDPGTREPTPTPSQSYNIKHDAIEEEILSLSSSVRPSKQHTLSDMSTFRMRSTSSDDSMYTSDAPSLFSQVSAVSSHTAYGASISSPNLLARPSRKPLPLSSKASHITLGVGSPFHNVEMHSIWKSLVEAERKFVDRMLKLKRMFYDNVIKQWPMLKNHLDAILVGEQIANNHQKHLLQVLDQELSGNGDTVCNPCVFENWVGKSQHLYQEYCWKMPHAVSSLRKVETTDPTFSPFVNKIGLSIAYFGMNWEDYLKLPVLQLQSYIDDLTRLIAIAETLNGSQASQEAGRLKRVLQTINQSSTSVSIVLEESQGREDVHNVRQRLCMDKDVLSTLHLDEPTRRVKHEGGMAFKYKSQGPWIPVHTVLFDHCLLWGKTKKSKGNEIFVSNIPIPLVDTEFSLPADAQQSQKATMLDQIPRGSVL